MLSRWSLEDCLSYVERVRHCLVRDGAERQEIVKLKRQSESKHVVSRGAEEEDTGRLDRVAHIVSIPPGRG